jgi:glycosyltransferase 2 family protein
MLKKNISAFFGIIISVTLISMFFYYVDFKESIKLVQELDSKPLLIALVFLAAGYCVRIVRWRTMLYMAHINVGYLNVSSAFMKSIALNNLLPLRAGDIYRLVSLPDRSIKKTDVAITLILERLLDLLALGVIFFTVSMFVSFEFFDIEMKNLLYLLLLPVLIVILLPLLISPLEKLVQKVFTQLEEGSIKAKITSKLLEVLHTGLRLYTSINLIKLIFLSLLCWILEGGTYLFVAYSLDLDFTVYSALAVLCVGTFSTLIPSSPGYFGTFHVAVTLFLISINVSETQAGAYAVLVHLLLWGGTTLVGVLFFISSKKSKVYE